MAVYSNTKTSSSGGGVVTVDIDLADNGGGGLTNKKVFDVFLSVQNGSMLVLKGGPSTPGNGYKIEGKSIRWHELELDLPTNPNATVSLQCKLKNCHQMTGPACIVVVVAERHADKVSRFFLPEWTLVDPCPSVLELPPRASREDWILRIPRDLVLASADDSSSDED